MCGVLMCMNVWIQVCAPHMWTTSVVSQSLGAFHLLFEIRSDIALELYHIGRALWLTHFQGSPSLLPRAGTAVTHHHAWLSVWVLEI